MANLVPIQDHREAERSINVSVWTWCESLHRSNKGFEDHHERVRDEFKDMYYHRGTFEPENYPLRYWTLGK